MRLHGKSVPPHFPVWPTPTRELRMNGVIKSSIHIQGGWEQSLMLTGTGVRKGTLFLSLWRLLPYRPADSFSLGRLWVEKWVFGFSVCLGFLFVLEVELKQKQAVVRGKCSVNVSYCHPTVAPNEFRHVYFSSCCWLWMEVCHAQKQRLQNGSLGSALVWGGNIFVSAPFLIRGQMPILSATPLLH